MLSPVSQISAGQPSTPANLKELLQIKRVNRHPNRENNENTENAELWEELRAVEPLERVVKGVIPFVDSNAYVNISQIQEDDRQQKRPRGPLFF